MTIKYIARFNDQIVGTRNSAAERVYTHAVVRHGPDMVPTVVTWCGRLDLARGEASRRQGRNRDCTYTIVPTEIKPSNKRTAAAFNESGVFAPFTVIGEDK